MAIGDIPVFREARRGQVVRSDDWNAVQRELRNGIRAHRHTRVAGGPANDAATEDLALQITTDEIADGAVTPAKLSSEAIRSLRTAPRASADADGEADGTGVGATRLVATDTLSLARGARERIEHGLGRVPVAVSLAIVRNVPELEGEYEVFGVWRERDAVFAAVPVEPDGTFTLISAADFEGLVRWWAFAASPDSARSTTGRRGQRQLVSQREQ